MKALDEDFLMVVFILLLNRLHVFANFLLIWTEKHGSERVKALTFMVLCNSACPHQNSMLPSVFISWSSCQCMYLVSIQCYADWEYISGHGMGKLILSFPYSCSGARHRSHQCIANFYGFIVQPWSPYLASCWSGCPWQVQRSCGILPGLLYKMKPTKDPSIHLNCLSLKLQYIVVPTCLLLHV